jgi:hypothetical protein
MMALMCVPAELVPFKHASFRWHAWLSTAWPSRGKLGKWRAMKKANLLSIGWQWSFHWPQGHAALPRSRSNLRPIGKFEQKSCPFLVLSCTKQFLEERDEQRKASCATASRPRWSAGDCSFSFTRHANCKDDFALPFHSSSLMVFHGAAILQVRCHMLHVQRRQEMVGRACPKVSTRWKDKWKRMRHSDGLFHPGIRHSEPFNRGDTDKKPSCPAFQSPNTLQTTVVVGSI